MSCSIWMSIIYEIKMRVKGKLKGSNFFLNYRNNPFVTVCNRVSTYKTNRSIFIINISIYFNKL